MEQNGKNSKGLIVTAVILLVLTTVAITVAVIMLLNSNSKGTENNDDNSIVAQETTEKITSKEEITTKPKEEETTTISGGVEEKLAEKTVIFYMIGSDLETGVPGSHTGGFMSKDIEEMIKANLSSDYKVVLQTGGSKNWHYEGVEDGKVQRFEVTDDKLVELDNLGVVNMSSPNTLSDFIKYAKENYKAKEYVLILADHGGSVPIGYGWDEMFPGEYLTITEIGDAIKKADIHFESIIFNACLMGNLEVVKTLKDYTDYIVASENIAWVSSVYSLVDFEAMLNNLQVKGKEETYYLEQIANSYVDDTEEFSGTSSMSVFRMSQADNVYNAYVEYMKEVYEEVVRGKRLNEYISARKLAEVATAQSVMDEMKELDSSDDLDNCIDTVDIVTLANTFKTKSSARLVSAVNNLILNRDTNSSKLNGLSVYSPYLLDESTYNSARSLFTELSYDKTIINFYDSFVCFRGGKESTKGYKWYNDALISAYLGDSGDDDKMAADEFTNKGTHTAWEVDFDKLVAVYTDFYVDKDDNNIYYLGYDEVYDLDTDEDIIVNAPSSWMAVSDGSEYAFITFFGGESYMLDDETTAWDNIALAYVNGKLAQIEVLVVNDGTGSETSITGYYLLDDEYNIISNKYNLKDSDKVEFLLSVINIDTGDVSFETVNVPMRADAIYLDYQDVNLGDRQGYIEITLEGIDGSEISSELIEL